MKNKRAQVTIFIIIGILLLVGVGLFFYITSQVIQKEIAPGVKISIERLPSEFQPVATFIESCMTNIGTNALNRIGQTGGFYEPINSNPLVPTESGSVELSPGSGLNVAYWYHLKDSNTCSGTCTFVLSKPFLHKKEGSPSIEEELEKYVDDNLNECFGDFTVFSGQGIEIIPLGDMKTDTYVTDDGVAFVLNYPLNLLTEGNEKTAEQFYVEIPLKLKKMYELADYITSLQVSNKFLERDVLNLITGFSGVDEHKLPPTSDFRFGYGGSVRWRKSQVRDDIVSMLTSYMPLLQVYGTRNYEEVEVYSNELGNSLYNEGMLIPTDGSFGQFETGFDYLGWQPYFELSPCKGDLCEPESMTFKLLQVFGMQNYEFEYDLSFPVLASINDPDALFGEGYLLQFMLEGNIRGNSPMSGTYESIRLRGAEESLFCDIDKRNSGMITINVKSPYDVPLDDVQVSYTCAGQDCFMGSTNQGILEAKFPICLGGVVSFLKMDYLGRYEYLNTEVDSKASLDVEIEPIRSKRITVRKKLIEKVDGGWTATLREEELSENEEAVITLTRKAGLKDDDYVTTAIIKGSGEEDISLYSGEYDIDIVIISRDRVVIPEREESEGFWIWEEEYTLPGMEFNDETPFISGGLKANYWFTNANLDNDVIVMYAIGIDLKGVPEEDRRIEDVVEMGKIEEYSRSYAGALTPRFE